MNSLRRPGRETAAPVRLLLINPRPPESFWSFRWAVDNVLTHERALNPPLGLATLAALCPEHWQVEIVDETVEPVPLAPVADIVGICGMGVQHSRQRELLSWYRERGYFTVAGGSFASLCPEPFDGLCDCVMSGESEYIWPRFCRDWEAGTVAPRYQEHGAVEMTDVPTPRFDLLKLDRYVTASVQFSRGCPYRCDFCDIIVMFGRRPRTKAPQQIGRELDALRAGGANSVFFVDDNLIGNKKVAKELLRYLIDYQRRHSYSFTFGTEASLDLADDPELIGLFRDAGFSWVFLGIETPDVESLMAAGKTQNTKTDLLQSVARIYDHGIDVFAGFIIGFDNDTPTSFDRQYRFIVDAGIQIAMVGLLTALPRTPLYQRLEREGRLRDDVAPGDNTRARTNVLPAGMPYGTMIEGYKALYRRLFSDRGIAVRIRNKTRRLRRPINAGANNTLGHHVRLMGRLLYHGILPGGPLRWIRFAWSLCRHPRLWQLVITDWIRGLSMRDYVRRHFDVEMERTWAAARRTVAYLRARFGSAFARGALDADLSATEEGPRLILTLRGALDRRFFGRGRRRLERLLRQSGTQLTLRIEHLGEGQADALRRLVDRLGRYGERVTVQLSRDLKILLPFDLTRVHVLIEDARRPCNHVISPA